MKSKAMRLCFLFLPGFALAAGETPEDILRDVVVTASPTSRPERVRIDLKKPMQPAPAVDGAGVLKAVPGMAVIRKGGMAGDPVFRGLGGSRLLINADDAFFYGGCGGRMDPPTAYVFPDVYDEAEIVKGPQTVTAGAGAVAGAVRFKRQPEYFPEAGVHGLLSVQGGERGRLDAMGEVSAGMPWAYVRLHAGHNRADDYRDGAGRLVHSAYRRGVGSFTLGLTPDRDTTVELGYDRSRGRASYADRMMDGVRFDRDAWRLDVERRNIAPWLPSLNFRYGRSEVDHVMDNYSLRRPGKKISVSNPDRITDNFRLAAKIDTGRVDTELGADHGRDRHRSRKISGAADAEAAAAYVDLPRRDNQSFYTWGVFAESRLKLDERNQIVAGLRHDRVKAAYRNKPVAADNVARVENLFSGFARYEYRNAGQTWFAGLGAAQRAPDFWERNKTDGAALRPETNVELTGGTSFKRGAWDGSLTMFAGRIDDYILIDGARARNIDARRYGFEGEVGWRFAPSWKAGIALAYTYGDNRSDNLPLAQIAPLESNSYIGYDNGKQAVRLLMRNVAAQHRYAEDQGGIAGRDTGSSSAFTVFSLNGSLKLPHDITLTAGIDNIFDKRYREFVNKTAADVAGYNPGNGLPIDEPGRTIWLRAQARF